MSRFRQAYQDTDLLLLFSQVSASAAAPPCCPILNTSTDDDGVDDFSTNRKAIRAKRSNAGNATILVIEQKWNSKKGKECIFILENWFLSKSTAPSHAFWGLSMAILEIFTSELRRHTCIPKNLGESYGSLMTEVKYTMSSEMCLGRMEFDLCNSRGDCRGFEDSRYISDYRQRCWFHQT